MNTQESSRRSSRLDVRLRRRFFFRLVAGTLLFCVVPVAIVVFVSSLFFTNRIVEEYRTSKRENLNAVMLDNARLMQEFSSYINYATDRDLVFFVDHSFHEDIVRFQQLLDRLSAQVAASEHIDSLHFFSGASGYMTTVSSDGYQFARFDPQARNPVVPTLDTGWLDALQDRRFFTPFYRADYRDSSESLSYIVPIFDRSRPHRTALIANIKLESVIRRVRAVSRDDGGNIYMVSDGTVIPLVTAFELSADKVSEMIQGEADEGLGATGGPFVVTSAVDTENGLHFVSLVPRSRLTRDLRSILSTYYVVIVLFTALLVAMAWIYTKRLYRPIEQVLEIVSSSDTAGASSSGRTALQHIAGEYRRVADLNAHLRERVESDREVVRDHVIDELLRGQVIADIEDTVPEFGVESRGLTYVVLIVHAEQNSDASARSLRSIWLQETLVEIIDDELEAWETQGLVCALSNGEVAVIVAHHSDTVGTATVAAFMQSISDQASSALDTEVHIGSSAAVVGLENIATGYRQAVEALRRGVVDWSVRIHSYVNVKRQETKTVESKRVVNRFTEVLARTDDADAVSRFVADFVRDAQKHFSHHSDLQSYCIESVINIMDYAERRSVGDAKRGLARFCEDLTACRTSGEIIAVIGGVLSGLAKRCREVIYPHGAIDANVARTLSYVDEHYHENIGLETVADAVGLNPSYLSRIFKRIVKTSFHEHLARVRVEKARSLLEATDTPIYEIARVVGFGSPLTLKRNFRKIEGCTPSDYRERRAHFPT